MPLCRREKCYWYSHDKRDEHGNLIRRKCYYEPGCILGYIDLLISLIKIAIRARVMKR